MITIPPGQRITRVLWHTDDLVLSSAFFWKGNVERIIVPSAGGTSFDSFNPAGAFNSLPRLTKGKAYDLVLRNIPLGGVTIDNGVPIQPSVYAVDGTGPVPGETVFDAGDQLITPTDPALLTAAFASGAGTPQISTDGTSTWTPIPAAGLAVAAALPLAVRVLHADGAAFYLTLTLTY